MSLKLANQEFEFPVWSNLSWPLWSRFDELFHDGEWRRPFKIEECHEKGEIVVRAELPGVDPEKGVKVEVVDDELVELQATAVNATSTTIPSAAVRVLHDAEINSPPCVRR